MHCPPRVYHYHRCWFVFIFVSVRGFFKDFEPSVMFPFSLFIIEGELRFLSKFSQMSLKEKSIFIYSNEINKLIGPI